MLIFAIVSVGVYWVFSRYEAAIGIHIDNAMFQSYASFGIRPTS